MAYTNIDDPSAYFQTTLYSGSNSSDLSVTNDGNLVIYNLILFG
jgi:hypothetical protein